LRREEYGNKKNLFTDAIAHWSDGIGFRRKKNKFGLLTHLNKYNKSNEIRYNYISFL